VSTVTSICVIHQYAYIYISCHTYVCVCVCARARVLQSSGLTQVVLVCADHDEFGTSKIVPPWLTASHIHVVSCVILLLLRAVQVAALAWAYTFNQWDNHSAVIDPITKAVTALPGNIKLLSHEWELAMMNDIRQRDGGQYDECLPTYHT
jgi:hypothetical protein